MTTVDTIVRRADRSGTELSLSNGLFGAATFVFQEVLDLARAGVATGDRSASHLEVTIKGDQLRPVIERLLVMESKASAGSGPRNSSVHSVSKLLDEFDDSADYFVWAVEF